MKNIRKLLVLTVMMLVSCLTLNAQVLIDRSTNAPRECDTIMRVPVGYLPAGDDGEDVVWDFSEFTPLAPPYKVFYFADSLGGLRCKEPSRMLKYQLRGDSLLLTGFETRLRSMTFTPAVCLAFYPSGYGDIHSDYFRGSGLYSERMSTETEGTASLEIDGAGSLILCEGDTLRNVLRLHYLKSASVWMHEQSDTLEVEPSARRQEIEEHYLWVARGYRYPVAETISTTYYDGLTMVSDRQEAYVSLPEWQTALTDSVNHEIQVADSLANLFQQAEPVMNYNYQLNPSGRLHIDYSLSETASITFLVCNAMGITYITATDHRPAGEGYSADIDCSGLLNGTYLLYINCNGQVYSETFKKQ